MKLEELIKMTFKILSAINISFVFSGAIAANAYRSVPRATMDLDIAIPFEEKYLEIIKEKFKGFVPENWDLVKTRLEIKETYPDVIILEFLRLKHPSGYEIDFSPLYPKHLKRKSKARVLNFEIDIIGPEDLILIKSFFSRHKDLDDIINILENSELELDLKYLIEELKEIGNQEIIQLIQEKRKSELNSNFKLK